MKDKRKRVVKAKSEAEAYHGVRIVPNGVMYVSMDESRALVEKNHLAKSGSSTESIGQFKNIALVNHGRPCGRRRTLVKDAHNLICWGISRKCKLKNLVSFMQDGLTYI